jgi:hypothetical protein
MAHKAVLCALDELFREKAVETAYNNRHLHSSGIQVSCYFFHLFSPFAKLDLFLHTHIPAFAH